MFLIIDTIYLFANYCSRIEHFVCVCVRVCAHTYILCRFLQSFSHVTTLAVCCLICERLGFRNLPTAGERSDHWVTEAVVKVVKVICVLIQKHPL